MSSLPKNKLGLLVIAGFLLLSLPAFLYVATVQQDIRIQAAKKDLSCDASAAAAINTKETPAQTIAKLRKTQTSLSELMSKYRGINGATIDTKSKIRQTANARKKLLLQTMRNDPNAALAILEKDKTLEKNLTNATSNCAAALASAEGTLSVGHADGDKKSKNFYVLKTKGGKSVSVHTAGNPQKALLSQMKIRAKGYQLDGDMLINTRASDAIQVTASAKAAEVEHAFGEQKTVVIMVDTTLSKSEVEKTVFTVANNFYKEVSYDNVSLSGEIYGPYSVGDEGCDEWLKPLNTQSIITAADGDIDFSDVNRVIILGNFTCPMPSGNPWGGYGLMGPDTIYSTDEGNGPFSVAWVQNTKIQTSVLLHELGHNFGVDHAMSCVNAFCEAPVEYGNTYDVMGDNTYFAPMGAPHRDFIGWFASGNVKTVTESGTYTIEPIGEKSDSLKALKIPRTSNFDGDMLYVEYRRPIGLDENLSEFSDDVYNGVLLQRLFNENKPAIFNPNGGDLQNAALKEGESYTDPTTKTVIKVTEVTDEQVTVDIDYKGPDVTPDPDEEVDENNDDTPEPCELTPTPDENDTDNDDDTDDPDNNDENPDTTDPDDEDGTDPTVKPTRDPNRVRRRDRDDLGNRIRNSIPTPNIRRPTITVVVPTPRKPVFNFPDWFPFNKENQKEENLGDQIRERVKNNMPQEEKNLGDQIRERVTNRMPNNKVEEDLGERIRKSIPTPNRARITIAPRPSVTVSVRKPSVPNVKEKVDEQLRRSGVQTQAARGRATDDCDPTPTPDEDNSPTPTPSDDSDDPTPTGSKKNPTPTTSKKTTPSPTIAPSQQATLNVVVKAGSNIYIPSASVTLDDGRTAGCTTDGGGKCSFKVKMSGKYKVTANKSGYASNAITVTIGQKTVNTEVQIKRNSTTTTTPTKKQSPTTSPTKYNVSVAIFKKTSDTRTRESINGSTAVFKLNGKEVASCKDTQTNACNVKLSKGTHQLSVTHPSYVAYSSDITVKGDADRSANPARHFEQFEVQLTPLAPTSRNIPGPPGTGVIKAIVVRENNSNVGIANATVVFTEIPPNGQAKSAGYCTTDSNGICTKRVSSGSKYFAVAAASAYKQRKSATFSISQGKEYPVVLTLVATERPDQVVGPQSVRVQEVNILNYNDIIDCYSDTTPARACDNEKKARADLNQDGRVNQIDYNLFITRLRQRP